MAHPSSGKRQIPTGFPDQLSAFARELLREYSVCKAEGGADGDSHVWIYKFAQGYFEKGGVVPARPIPAPSGAKVKVTARAGERGAAAAAAAAAPLAAPPAGTFPTAKELQHKIQTIFRSADRDGSGTLDHREFRTVLKQFASDLGLPLADVRQLMSLADENSDGFVDYGEFVPIALGVLEAIYAKRRFDTAREARAAEAEASSKSFLLHGMPRAELEAAIRKVFSRADLDGSGVLSRAEFADALRGSALGLTRREINMLMAEADDNSDGAISYDEFVPVCFNLLSEMIAKQIEYSQLPVEEAQIAEYLLRMFRLYDQENSGRLHLVELAAALRESDVGLSQLQLQAVLSEANADDEDGTVNYRDFSVAAAGLISSMISVASDAEAASRIVELRSRELSTVMNMDADSFKAQLLELLLTCAKGDSGRANAMDVVAILRDELHFDTKQVNAIVNLARASGDASKDNTVEIAAVVEHAFDALRQLVEWDIVRGTRPAPADGAAAAARA